MSIAETEVEQVYAFIWQYVQEREALPSYADVSAALNLDKEQVSACVRRLRAAGKITPTTLLPTDYCAWWREHLRAHWSYRALRQS